MSFTTRYATNDDIYTIYRQALTFGEEVRTKKTVDEDLVLQSVAEYVNPENDKTSAIMLYSHAGYPIGFALIIYCQDWHVEHDGHIQLFWIDKSWRGLGASRKLVKACIKDYKSKKKLFPVEGLRAGCISDTRNALAYNMLFKDFGFELYQKDYILRCD